MKVANYAIFRSAFDEEWTFDSNDEIETPGGKTTLEAIREHCDGCKTQAWQRDDYGWEFNLLTSANTTTNILVQNGGFDDNCLLIVDEMGIFLSRRRKRKAHLTAIRNVKRALRSVEEITDIVWLTPTEFDRVVLWFQKQPIEDFESLLAHFGEVMRAYRQEHFSLNVAVALVVRQEIRWVGVESEILDFILNSIREIGGSPEVYHELETLLSTPSQKEGILAYMNSLSAA